MWHANGLSDGDRLNIYPCSTCGGALHVGHLPAVHDLAWQIAKSKRGITSAEAALAGLVNPDPETLFRQLQSLRDRKTHLARLENPTQPPAQWQENTSKHDLGWRIARCKLRILRKQKAIASFTNSRRKTLRRHEDSLRDLHAHLATLEAQAIGAKICLSQGC